MERINKSDGVNKSEKYLSKIAERTFLSLWSYPNPHKQPGTEMADLLVVHGQDIIIFSDKDIGWSADAEIKVAWSRWYKRAVKAGAESVSGAAKWIREHPDRVYMNAANSEKIPFDLASIRDPRFHLVAVCSGVEEVIKKHYGDRSGTFMLASHVKGNDHLLKAGSAEVPYFTIGDVSPTKEFVHIFSRSGLDCVMREFDTITDFIGYLKWRAEGFREQRVSFSAGEEELVAVYWGRMRETGWDLTKLYAPAGKDYGLTVVGGVYREMTLEPGYLQWKLTCGESRFWDSMIEEFSKHVISGKVPTVAGHIPSFAASENVLRFMASETREQRIILSQAFKGMLRKSVEGKADRYVRKFPLRNQMDTYGYVFMVSTFHPDSHGSYSEYREGRANAIGSYCLDMLQQVSQLQHVIGIAIDTSPEISGRIGSSEDVMLVERPEFDAELLDCLKLMRDDLEIKPINIKELLKNIKNVDRMRKRLDQPSGPKRKRAFRP